ncbi:MAG TPA: tetratricopeptide repeat protein [Thermoanaerobaculia bacterium]|nr:tetratricopeptide repeat protein [Thermoanaerobaculia bacterium]
MNEHIPDLELSYYAFDPDSIAPERQAKIQRHTASCDECGQRLNFYLVAEDDLHDPMVWGTSSTALPASLQLPPAIRAFTNRCTAEDADADVLLAPFFSNPAKAMWANLPRQREFRTSGVVRRLNAHADSVAATEPATALIFADLARAIADVLPHDLYPNNALFELRGTAWKTRGHALLLLGRFDEAVDSLRCAEREYGRLTSPILSLADVDLARAAVYYQLEELERAATHAERAEHTFAQLGQEHRRLKALLLRGSIRYLALDLGTASAIFQQVIEYGEAADSAHWIAQGSYARANCELDRGKIAEASMLFHAAMVIFREIGAEVHCVATQWGLARVLLHSGRPADAASRLREVMRAFERMSRVMEVAFVGLDLADALVVLQQPKQVVKVAAHAFRILKEAGVVTSALTALAYLKEAASHDRLSRELIHEIRTFMRRAERHPELLFVPPPEQQS